MSITRGHGPRQVAVSPFDIDTTGSDSKLAALTRALVVAGGWWTDAGTIGNAAPTGRNTVLFRAWIPDGLEGQVAKDSRCEGIRVPPCLALNDGKDARRTCAACGKAYNARVDSSEHIGDGPLAVLNEKSSPPTCSIFCAGRLAGRDEEREACAKVAFERFKGAVGDIPPGVAGTAIANAIRARGVS